MEATGETMKGTWSFGCSCSPVVEFSIVKDGAKTWIECLQCGSVKTIVHARKKVMVS
jgi:uncharacterized Zn finger protein